MMIKMKFLSSTIVYLSLCPLVVVQGTRLRGSTSATDADSSGATAMVIDQDIDHDMPSDEASVAVP